MNEVIGGLEIAAGALAAWIEAGDPVQILDVRAPERLANGTVDIGPKELFFNIRGSKLLVMPDVTAEARLNPDVPVVAVCGHGHDSLRIAHYLNDRGFRAQSLAGGMTAWNGVLVAREIAPPPGFDRLVQFDRVAKGSLSYLLSSGGNAIVIDAPRNYSEIKLCAESARIKITAVADTHAHADYISGGPELAAALGVPYYLHPADNAYPYDGTPGKLRIKLLLDGVKIPLGSRIVSVVHTPGHTEGSVTFLAGDAALTGDFLFVSSIGRPDLAGKTTEWGAALLNSIKRVKSEWPDNCRVLPAHYGGSGERNNDKTIWRTLGELKKTNPHLLVEDGAEFLKWIEARIKTPPPAYKTIKAVNIGIIKVETWEADALEGGKNECALV